MKKLNKKGFTIVELVIVIAVIGILAGVLIPTFTIVVRKANESAAIQALDTARKELSTFVDAATEDFSAFDDSYVYYYAVEKKGQNYTNLQGYWQYDNGAWKQVAAPAANKEVFEYNKIASDATYIDATYYTYNKNTGVYEDASVDSENFATKKANYTLYLKGDQLEIQGVKIFKL